MSKWILIEVENNDILEPSVFDNYDDAYKEMDKRFHECDDVDVGDNNIHSDYASVQTDMFNLDWRIFEVKM